MLYWYNSAIGSLVYSYIKYAEQQEHRSKNSEVIDKVKGIEELEQQDNEYPPKPPHLT